MQMHTLSWLPYLQIKIYWSLCIIIDFLWSDYAGQPEEYTAIVPYSRVLQISGQITFRIFPSQKFLSLHGQRLPKLLLLLVDAKRLMDCLNCTQISSLVQIVSLHMYGEHKLKRLYSVFTEVGMDLWLIVLHQRLNSKKEWRLLW